MKINFMNKAHTAFKTNVGGGDMVLNTTFNNISVISWRSVLLVEETGENWHRPVVSHGQTSSHKVLSPEWGSNSQR